MAECGYHNIPERAVLHTIWARLTILPPPGRITQVHNHFILAMNARIQQVAAHVFGTKGLSNLEQKRPNDVVITMAVRSPLCKARKGGFKDARSVLLRFG